MDKPQISKDERGAAPFPVAGIGASAGGLQALKKFLNHLPVNTGIAFVIIQHLSAEQESILPELLEKETEMPVYKVEDKMALKPNAIFVIPPKVFISISDGHLTLLPRQITSGIFLPINYFFKHLGYIYQNKSIGILLSGTGSDGTEGFRDIKARGGITFAQDDAALFGGMPQSAAEAGFVDIILPVEKIAAEVGTILNHPYTQISVKESEPENQTDFNKIIRILLQKKRIDFSLYKQSTINRRILRRMALRKKTDLEDYIQLLRKDEVETDQLYQDLLINVTSFFRDPSIFEGLINKVLPKLYKDRTQEEILRIWIPACSSGEEAISFAISIFDYSVEHNIPISFQIFATDLNARIVEKARSGIYLAGDMENISQQHLEKYFKKINGHYQVIKQIRDVCVFSTHNLLSDPPFSRMDIVSCQNVLIYFTNKAQEKILKAFNYALKPSGFLFLGKSESIGTSSFLFSQVEKEPKIYSKKVGDNRLDYDFSFPSRSNQVKNTSQLEKFQDEKFQEPDIEKEIEKLLLLSYVQPSVLIDNDLQILRFHGQTSPFLQPAFGKASLNLLRMVREDLVFELKILINRVKKEKVPLKKTGIQLIKNGIGESLDLEIIPLRITSTYPYFLILFHPAGTDEKIHENKKETHLVNQDEKDQRIELFKRELQEMNDNARTLSEEYEESREELQSANEEVLSSNEELQSINEELETSKEELQSSNEELTTINDELQLRIQELKDAFQYREAIVETLREPLLVLNSDLRIVSGNRAFYENYVQSKQNTEGFLISQAGNGQWNIPGLEDHLKEIIFNKVKFEDFEVSHKFPNLGERIFLFSATRMSFEESSKNRILLVIQDISERRQAEEALKKALNINTLILDSINDIFISVDTNWHFSYLNKKAEEFLNHEKADLLGKNFWDFLTNYLGTEFHTNLVSTMKLKKFSQFEFYDKNTQEWYDFRLFPSESLLTIYASRITEQKLSMEVIQQSKERYETFISEHSEGIWRIELKKAIPVTQPKAQQLEELYKNAYVAESNDAIAKMYGYDTAQQLHGIAIGEILSRNDKNDASLMKFIESGYRLSDVEIMEIIHGEASFFLINLVGIISKDYLRRIWGTQRNITEQKNGEIELRKVREKLNFSLKAGSVGTFTWDLSSGLISISDIMETIYGIKNGSFKGSLKGWFKFLYPADISHVKASIRKSIELAEELKMEFRIVRADNSIGWIMTRANLVLNEQRKPIEMTGISIDISESKFREELIKENEKRFRALVQNAFDVITIFNFDGQITYQSDSIENILGYNCKERMGQNIYLNSIVDSRDRDIEKELIQKSIDSPYKAFQKELRMTTKNGETRIMEVSCINLLNNPSIRGIIKNYRDITTRRVVEKQKEEFIGVASHELKTPVTSIKAYTQILQDIFEEKNDGVAVDLLNKLDKQIDRLTNLIKNLLDITKINEGKLALNKQEFDLNDLIIQMVEEMQVTTKKHELVMQLEKSVFVFGDMEKISQVLVNLLSNAIKYSPDSAEVYIKQTISKDEVIISIQDFGIGISEEIQKNLFSRFFRVIDESTKTFPGLGLGLYISAEIINRHDGRIWVDSDKGKGSIFTFTLPLHREILP